MVELFRVEVAEAVLEDLRERLVRSRVPKAMAGSGWSQGTEPGYLNELLETWRTDFDWRAAEARLNAFPQYTTVLGPGGQGEASQGMHFLHVRSPHPDARPLLLLHGWPGSVLEFLKIIPMLTRPEDFGGSPGEAFHVVAPSLPGYGYSEAPREPGANPRRIAGWMHRLMHEVLGYSAYWAQGGDWGSVIASWVAFDHPEAVRGLHLNMAGLRPTLGPNSPTLSDAEKAFLAEAKRKRGEDFAYQAIQGTRPQTLGVALHDSPAGLAAWIVEKFRDWSDCGGDVEASITRDEILTNLTWYWVTGSITSSMRLYYEFRRSEAGPPEGVRVEVPTAFAAFPREILNPPRSWVERAYNVVRWRDMPRGGHFAALEQPMLLAEDIRGAF